MDSLDAETFTLHLMFEASTANGTAPFRSSSPSVFSESALTDTAASVSTALGGTLGIAGRRASSEAAPPPRLRGDSRDSTASSFDGGGIGGSGKHADRGAAELPPYYVAGLEAFEAGLNEVLMVYVWHISDCIVCVLISAICSWYCLS